MENLITPIENSIKLLADQFTTHELVITLAKNNQHEYIKSLNTHIESEQPFKTLHSKIGKHLAKQTELISNTQQDQVDADIFGQRSSNALWKKV